MSSCPSLTNILAQGRSSLVLKTVSLGQNYQENQMRTFMQTHLVQCLAYSRYSMHNLWGLVQNENMGHLV